ncbi:MAG: acylphosphatase [Candidatus Eisenbacteria bacterium]
MGEIVRVRVRVSGVVQGVGFRYFARKAGTSFGLAGSVKNLPDGSVEVVAQGEEQAVHGFLSELKVGPRYASIERVDIRWEKPENDFRGFDYAF